MLDEETKLLITAYVDGELSHEEIEQLKSILEWSADARDQLQRELMIARRVKQAFGRSTPPQRERGSTIAKKLILQASKERQARKSAFLPAATLLLIASAVLVWIGVQVFQKVGSLADWANPEVASGPGSSSVSDGDLLGDSRETNQRVAFNDSDSQNEDLSPDKDGQARTRRSKAGELARRRTGKTVSKQEVITGLEREGGPLEIALSGSSMKPEDTVVFGAPVSPEFPLRRLDLSPPQIIKLKQLNPENLREVQGQSCLRIDLPTYQEVEGVKRLMKTLKSEGCKVSVDQATEERLRKNLSLGPVSISIFALEPEKLCLALQRTSKVVGGRPGNSQPTSVFDELVLHPFPFRDGENQEGSEIGVPGKTGPSRGNSPGDGQALALIQSGLVGKGASSLAKTKGLGGASTPGETPVVILQIFPLR